MTVQIVGGLGNQLFGYYAGFGLARRLGAELYCDARRTRWGWTDHGLEIMRFDLPAKWLLPGTAKMRLLPPGSRRFRVASKIGAVLGLNRKYRPTFVGSGVGFESALYDQPVGSVVDGWFQSWRHVQEAVDRGAERVPRLFKETAWLTAARREAETRDIVAVQVRRGDYTQAPSFGLLSRAYFEAGLRCVGADPMKDRVWVFSDDPKAAIHCLPRGWTYIHCASPAGDGETLVGLSLAKRIVISNSTYGWWGAWMAGGDARVAVPEPWFRSRPQPLDMSPPRWTRVASHWI